MNDLGWTPLHNNQIVQKKKTNQEKKPRKETCKQGNPTHEKNKQKHSKVVEMSKF
jgi:hypothetical protein